MAKSKKILLIGHYGFVNRGCEAIVRGTAAIIQKCLPGSTITLISRRPGPDQETCQRSKIGVTKVVPSHGTTKRFSPRWFTEVIDRRLLKAPISHYDHIHTPLYREHDIVFSIGGDSFTDDYGVAGEYFESLVRAKRAGAKTAIWGASIGPFRDREKAREWAGIMNGLDLITARESMTRKYLQELGVTENVRLIADPAFMMEPCSPNPIPEIFASGDPVVGLGISDLLAYVNGSGEKYVQESASFVQHLVKDLKFKVLLVPHVVEGEIGTDDFGACQRVMAKVGNLEGVEVLKPHYDAAELKYLIGRCAYFIGARTHSTIASLSLLVPTVSVAYSVKAFGINREIFGSDDYVLPREKLSVQTLGEKMDLMLQNRKAIVANLTNRVPELKAQSLKAGEHLAQLWD